MIELSTSELSVANLQDNAMPLQLMHASTCSYDRNGFSWGLVCTKACNRLATEQEETMVSMRGNAGVRRV